MRNIPDVGKGDGLAAFNDWRVRLAFETQGIQFLGAGQVAQGCGVVLKEWHVGNYSEDNPKPTCK